MKIHFIIVSIFWENLIINLLKNGWNSDQNIFGWMYKNLNKFFIVNNVCILNSDENRGKYEPLNFECIYVIYICQRVMFSMLNCTLNCTYKKYLYYLYKEVENVWKI